MVFAVAGSAIYERPGPCHTLDAPGLLGRPVVGTDGVPVRLMTLGEALAGLGPDPRCPSCAWRSGRLEFVAALPPTVSCTVRPSNVAIRRSRSDEPDRRFGWAHTYRG